jgi:hypothetical protein
MAFEFHFPLFLIAFSLGFLYVYAIGPERKAIIKYPTPFNSGKLIYKDSANNCFIYESKKVVCPEDSKKITQQPVV